MLLDDLAVDAIGNSAAFSTVFFVNFSVQLGEAPLAGGNDQLTARELELGTTEGFQSVLNVLNKSVIKNYNDFKH